MMTTQETFQTESTQPAEPSDLRRCSKIPKWLMIWLLLLTAGMGVSVYRFLQSRQDMAGTLHTLHLQMRSIKTQQADDVSKLDRHVKNMETLQKNGLELDKQITALKQMQHQSNDDALYKVRAYLELAQMNAYTGAPISEISALLTQADKQLMDMHETRLLEVRRVLDREMAKVKAIEAIDYVGLLNQLDAAQHLVDALQTKRIPEKGSSQTPTVTVNTSMSDWRARLKDSINILKKLVVVRRVDEQIQPLMTPSLAALLRANIQLTLQETQFALVQRNESLYQLTLKQALEKISQFFDPLESNTLSLTRQLETLQQTNITQEKLTLGQALFILNQLIDAKTDAVTQDETGAAL
jgi:uroporphyrin-3 C-methyltransferase